ncbi:MAG: aminomethyl-transferring glycine dehydrogenase subunit GcvPA [Alphaproteobacteria bacterium]|nr:aminomethyl-transferring glycine dehydrogenase subunit GcvPA [Alphaproteobacteria bacterium]
MRYLPHTAADRSAMLSRIGVKNIDALFKDVPAKAQRTDPVALPYHLPEALVAKQFKSWAAANANAETHLSFLGAGIYSHAIPASVDALIQRGEFLTSYTPYQPEIAQGTLQYLFEFQTQIALLTGMDIANASLYDGSTACVEAIQMAMRVTGRKTALLSGGLHPEYRAVAETYAHMTGFSVTANPPTLAKAEDLIAQLSDTQACVVVQYPDFFGEIQDYKALAAAAKAKGILVIAVFTELLALGALQPPGAWGADIACGEGQSLACGASLGGPHVGLFACRKEYLRQLPGRICGETLDTEGRRGFVLTLSTREQHIRRDKATSNICTNSGLIALALTIHLSLLGSNGLTQLAALNHANAALLADALVKVPGVKVHNTAFFNEILVELPKAAAPVVSLLAAKGILAGVPVSRFYPQYPNHLLLAASEATDAAAIETLTSALRGVL